MLDDMIAVVDEGFSYDGIVSIPQAGLEDVKYRSDMANSFRGSVVSHISNLLTASSCGLRYRIKFGRRPSQGQPGELLLPAEVRNPKRS